MFKNVSGKMMKRSSLAILCCFLLSACIFDPVVDASSWDAYQRSMAAIRAKLSNDDLRRFDVALKYMFVETTPNIPTPAPNLILARLGPRINGESAATIIQNLSLKLDREIAQAETRLQNSEDVLGAVEISSASYYWRRSGYVEQPVIEFSVRNNGKFPILRAYFRVVLTTPNRTIPWATQEYVQNFKGGLEPREKQQLTFRPQGDWNDKQLKDMPNAELKVTVINFDNANGDRMITVDSDSLDFKRKVRASLH
jgi:hypothetical protein